MSTLSTATAQPQQQQASHAVSPLNVASKARVSESSHPTRVEDPLTWPMLIAYAVDAAQLSLPQTALYLLLAKGMKVSPEAIASFYATIFIPWFLKLAYAWLSDAVPVRGYRRRPYLALFNVVASVCFFFTAVASNTFSSLLALSFATQVCLCASEVMLDSLAVDLVVRQAKGGSYLAPNHLKSLLLGQEPRQGSAVATPPPASDTERAEAGVHSQPSVTRPGSKSNKVTVGRIQATCLQARYAGTVVATVCSIGLLAIDTAPRTIILATAALPLLTAALAAFLISERPVVDADGQPVSCCAGCNRRPGGNRGSAGSAGRYATLPPSGRNGDDVEHGRGGERLPRHATLPQLFMKLLRAMFTARRPLWPTLLLAFVLQAMPTTTAVLPSFYIEVIHMAGWRLNVVTAIGSVGSLCGCALYARYMSRYSLWPVLVASTVIGALGGCTQILLSLRTYETLGIPPVVFASVDGFLVGATNAVAYLPIVVLAAAAAPEGLEATAFAAMLSITDASSSLSDYLSSLVASAVGLSRTHWTPLTAMILICNVARLLPLIVMSPIRHDVSALIRPDGRRYKH